MNYGSGPLGPPPPGAPPGPGGPPGYGPPGRYGPPGGGGYGPPAGGYGAVNPYQAPGAMMTSTAGLVDPPGGAMKWLYIAGHAGYWLFAIGGVVAAAALGGGGSSDAATMASLVPLLGIVFLVVALVAAMVWLHKSWSSVPDQMRYTDAGRWITPGQAVGYNFIPFYNLYWVFVANLGLCEAINRTLVSQGKQPRAPKGLAIAACVSQLVPYCNLLVGPILWAVYMFMVDGARREMMSPGG
ncbi:MAG TPA: DUF4328 domain-containing protein [Polyangiaceae bacterium]|nr:DUF4328 domain-containing protein [Polyangiaceae bacterium]